MIRTLLRPVTLDFVHKPAHTPWLGLALCALGVIVALEVTARFEVAAEKQKTLTILSERLSAQTRQVAKQAELLPPPEPVDAKVDAVREAQRINLLKILDALGSVWQQDIALTKVDVTTESATINLTLEARSLPDALAFVDNLARHPMFYQVNMSNYSVKTQAELAQKPLTASVEARWKIVR